MTHNHTWHIRSSHRTSGGVVRYLGCSCGAQRIDLGAAALAFADSRHTVELQA